MPGGHHTRLVTANYWTRYGARKSSSGVRLFGKRSALATWTEDAGEPEASHRASTAGHPRAFRPAGIHRDSLFIHAIGVAGHDIVKYALDTYGDAPNVLSATHDANSWPSDLYAGLPAPADGEDVVLWVQNSHPITITAGEIGLGPRWAATASSRLHEADRAFCDARAPHFGHCCPIFAGRSRSKSMPASISCGRVTR